MTAPTSTHNSRASSESGARSIQGSGGGPGSGGSSGNNSGHRAVMGIPGFVARQRTAAAGQGSSEGNGGSGSNRSSGDPPHGGRGSDKWGATIRPQFDELGINWSFEW